MCWRVISVYVDTATLARSFSVCSQGHIIPSHGNWTAPRAQEVDVATRASAADQHATDGTDEPTYETKTHEINKTSRN